MKPATKEAIKARSGGRNSIYLALRDKMRAEGWVCISEAASTTGMSASTLYSWTKGKKPKLKTTRVGKKYLFVELSEVSSFSIDAMTAAIRAGA